MVAVLAAEGIIRGHVQTVWRQGLRVSDGFRLLGFG